MLRPGRVRRADLASAEESPGARKHRPQREGTGVAPGGVTDWVNLHLHIPAMHIDSMKQTSKERGLEEPDLPRLTFWPR